MSMESVCIGFDLKVDLILTDRETNDLDDEHHSSYEDMPFLKYKYKCHG